MRTASGLIIGVAALTMAGCGSEKLQCHDKVVADTLQGIVAENASKEAPPEAVAALLGGGSVSLSQTLEKSRSEAGALQCSGVLTVDVSRAAVTPDQMAKNLSLGGAYIELERRIDQIFGSGGGRAEKLAAVRENMPTIAGPGSVTWNIEYDVQRTSDGKDVFVNLQAAQPIITYVAYYAQTNAKVAPKPPQADEGSSAGTYSNDRMTITDERRANGIEALSSSLCPGRVFDAVYDAGSGLLNAQDRSFGMSFGLEHAHMDVEGANKCFPEGRYRKVK